MWTRRKRPLTEDLGEGATSGDWTFVPGKGSGVQGAAKATGKKLPGEKKTALAAATDMLARQVYSIRKLVEKLRRKDYRAEEIVAALRRLKELHYLDERGACERQFHYLYEESRKSVRQIVVTLLKRGYPKELVISFIPKNIYEREKAAALRSLHVKYRPTHDRRKMMANLCRNGFDASAVYDAVRIFTASIGDEEK